MSLPFHRCTKHGMCSHKTIHVCELCEQENKKKVTVSDDTVALRVINDICRTEMVSSASSVERIIKKRSKNLTAYSSYGETVKFEEASANNLQQLQAELASLVCSFEHSFLGNDELYSLVQKAGLIKLRQLSLLPWLTN